MYIKKEKSSEFIVWIFFKNNHLVTRSTPLQP